MDRALYEIPLREPSDGPFTYFTYVVSLAAHFATVLEKHEIPYAVIGGLAVCSHIAGVDADAVRTSCNADFLIEPVAIDNAVAAAQAAGYSCEKRGVVECLQVPGDVHRRGAVKLVPAGLPLLHNLDFKLPSVGNVTRAGYSFDVLALEPLVVTYLGNYRMKDRLHLEDLLRVGLLDESWMQKVPEPLRTRMREVLDNPADDI